MSKFFSNTECDEVLYIFALAFDDVATNCILCDDRRRGVLMSSLVQTQRHTNSYFCSILFHCIIFVVPDSNCGEMAQPFFENKRFITTLPFRPSVSSPLRPKRRYAVCFSSSYSTERSWIIRNCASKLRRKTVSRQNRHFSPAI